MYEYSQVINGIAKFVDTEMLTKMTGIQKWVAGSGIGILLSKGANTFSTLKQNEYVKMLGIVDENDKIDIDTIYTELKKQAQKCNAVVDLPMLGTITLNESDVDRLYQLITKS